MTIDDKLEVQDASTTVETTTTLTEATPATLTTTDEGAGTEGTGSAAKPAVLHEVRNCTNDHVKVTAGSRCFHLSPLGMADVDEETVDTFALRSLAEQHVLRVSDSHEATTGAEGGVVFGLAFWAIVGYFWIMSGIDTPRLKWVFGIGVAGGRIHRRHRDPRGAEEAPCGRRPGLSLIVIFLLGAGVPVGVVLAFGDMADLVRDGTSAELFGRLTQTFLIVLAALVPTVLYYIFDRQRAMTIRRNFQQQIVRLDPTIGTLYDVDAKYGDLLIEVVGRDGVQRARANRSNPYPLFHGRRADHPGVASGAARRRRGPGFADQGTISSYLEPRQTTYVFGFLGAYFFAVNLIARRYVRGDLRPKAYGAITVRMLTVFILSWVLEVTFEPDDWLFVAGSSSASCRRPSSHWSPRDAGRSWGSSPTRSASPSVDHPRRDRSLRQGPAPGRGRQQRRGARPSRSSRADARHSDPRPAAGRLGDQAILYLHTVDEKGNVYGPRSSPAHVAYARIRLSPCTKIPSSGRRSWPATRCSRTPGSISSPPRSRTTSG